MHFFYILGHVFSVQNAITFDRVVGRPFITTIIHSPLGKSVPDYMNLHNSNQILSFLNEIMHFKTVLLHNNLKVYKLFFLPKKVHILIELKFNYKKNRR